MNEFQDTVGAMVIKETPVPVERCNSMPVLGDGPMVLPVPGYRFAHVFMADGGSARLDVAEVRQKDGQTILYVRRDEALPQRDAWRQGPWVPAGLGNGLFGGSSPEEVMPVATALARLRWDALAHGWTEVNRDSQLGLRGDLDLPLAIGRFG
jgi:hypothetical protein